MRNHPPAFVDSSPGNFYVSALRDSQYALLLGPFTTHADALANVEHGKELAIALDPWGAFDAYGTVRMRDSYKTPGAFSPGGAMANFARKIDSARVA